MRLGYIDKWCRYNMNKTQKQKAELEKTFFNADLTVAEIFMFRAEIVRLGKLNPTKIKGDHILDD